MIIEVGMHKISETSIATALEGLSLLKKVDDDWVGKLWRLTKHGNDVFTLPIPFFIRLLVLNHLYHHRGQLSTYLRTLGFLLPSIYGPSADEDPFA